MGRSLCPLMWLSVTNSNFKNYNVEEAEIETSSRGPTGHLDGASQGAKPW